MLFYDNLEHRGDQEAPSADLYIAGFPCQPLSTPGKQQGFDDAKGRGSSAFQKLREYIAVQAQGAFILEDVAGPLRLHGGRCFETIMSSLQALRLYNLHRSVMDTKEGVGSTS